MEKNQFPEPSVQKRTTFKTIVYFKQKPDNSYYSIKEIEELKHLKYIGSFDIRRGKDKRWVVDEAEAYRKQVSMIQKGLYGRYKTAFIVVNNYRGYSVVLVKWVEDIMRFRMDIKFYETNQNTGENRIYSIPAADNLIELHKQGKLSDAQKTLIKPFNPAITVANPYYNKISLTNKTKP